MREAARPARLPRRQLPGHGFRRAAEAELTRGASHVEGDSFVGPGCRCGGRKFARVAVRAMETATDDDDKGGSSSGGFSFSPPKPPSAGGDGGEKKHKKDKKKKHKKEKGGGEADARKGPMVDAFMKAIEAQRAEAKRAKLAARLRPTVWTDWRDEFAIEWKACPLPTAHARSARRKECARPRRRVTCEKSQHPYLRYTAVRRTAV